MCLLNRVRRIDLRCVGTLAAGTGATLLSGIPTGGASIPVVGGAALAISGALTANAVTAYATSGIMNSIANSHSGNTMGAGEAEDKEKTTQGKSRAPKAGKPHRHKYKYNDKGQPVGEEVVPVPK